MWRMTRQALSVRPYAVVRHCMYAGLVWGSVGAAMLTGSPLRALLAGVLAAVMNAQAAAEEVGPSTRGYTRPPISST